MQFLSYYVDFFLILENRQLISVLLGIGRYKITYRSFGTTVLQLKISDLSEEKMKDFEVLYFSRSVTTTQLLSSGEFLQTAL